MRKKKVKFVHKHNSNLFIAPADQHFCQSACVKTFASGSVWDLFDHNYIPDCSGLELHFDFDDTEHGMRAYQERKSGVLILETGLWDDRGLRSDYDGSVFKECVAEESPINTQEKYDFVAKKPFSIRGFDDLGRIAHNMISIPRGTKFTWVKEGLNLFDPNENRGIGKLPIWHMTSLRNAQIGIEIDLPTRYLGLVLKPMDTTANLPKDLTPYPDHVFCRSCRTRIGVPHGVLKRSDRDPFAAHRLGPNWKEYSIEDWLCDECYEDIFNGHQHTWAFQVEGDSFIPVW